MLEASSVWKPTKGVEAKERYGTSSLEHPTLPSLILEQGQCYVGGRENGISNVQFKSLVQTRVHVRETLPAGKEIVIPSSVHTSS